MNKQKAILKFPDNHKIINNPNITIPISVGQPYHENEKLCAQFKSISAKFSSITVLIADTLQRHTIQITQSISEKHSIDEAKKRGDKWLRESLGIINGFSIDYKIIHWDYWLTTNSFFKQYQFVLEHYEKDQLFRKVVSAIIYDFLTRFQKKFAHHKKPRQVLEKLCRDYLLEESAMLLVIAAKGYHYEIYPKARNLVMQYIYKNFIAYSTEDLAVPITVKFKKVRS